MRRSWQLVLFELRFGLRKISTWVYFGVLAFFSFMLMLIFGGAFPGASAAIEGTDGNVLVNSPHVLLILIGTFSLFGTLVVAAVAGNAGYRDFGEQMHALVFTTPTTRFEYVASRYLGAVVVNLLVLGGVALGLWLGTIVPWVEADRFGANSLAAYVRPYLLVILPNVLFTTAIFLSLALLTRKRMPHYIGGVGLLLGYMLSQTLAGDLKTKWIAGLLDPFGISSIDLATQYWTTVEKNTQLLDLSGWLLINRLLWIGIALVIVAIAVWRFRFSHVASEGRKRRKTARMDDAESAPSVLVEIPAAERSFGPRAAAAQLRVMTGRCFREVVASPYFIAILLAGLLFMVLNSIEAQSIFGTRTWPMAWKVIEILGGSFSLFVVILITLYAGELVWRERDLRLDQVVDTAPTPSWIGYAAKLIALSSMVVVLLVAVIGAGMVNQALLGFFRFEPLLYLRKLLAMQLLDYLLLCVLALAVQTVVNHKYTGHFILILFYVAIDLMPLFGVEHVMWRYGSDLGQTYSDMNGHGWYAGPFLWLKLYWGGFALMLAVLSNLLWPRGVDGRVRQRFHSARLRMRGPAAATLALGATVALGSGGFVLYNTNSLNTYRSGDDLEELQARYEKEYKEYESLPQPRITGVSLEVDLFPRRGEVAARGTYRLVNRTDGPIDSVHLLIDSLAEIRKLEFASGAELQHADADLGYRIYVLDQPLAAGEVSSLDFDLFFARRGFAHDVNNAVVDNGTFVNSSVLPSFGYDPGRELVLDRERQRHDLDPRERMRDLDDPLGPRDNYISRDADWVDFEVVLSTSPDQIALAPGYLQREWETDGRRYFHYKMDAPILNFFSFLSARYEVRRDAWGDVPIEVYYHPGHEFNLERMIESVKKSLDYFSTEFSPYQHRQLRILEFPRYATFAQSFPNTIPYSEGIGFIARVQDDDIDYPFFVTAHEVAHQWWAHQVIGGNMQGSTTLSETLAEYSALMVMEHEFGAARIREFLEYELDAYLRGRSRERKKELPLLRVEDQAYVHYNKGALVMYALRDAIGEQAVNRALARLIQDWGFKGPPYPSSRDLLAALRAETPPDLQPWLSDLFEHITIYDNRAVEAVSAERADGKFDVTLRFQARKMHATGQGEETEVGLNDPVDIGVFDAEGEPLYLEKHRLDGSTSEVTVVVAGKPASAGIDPYHKLIDRHPDDNETTVR